MTAAEMDIIIGAEVNGAVTGLKKVNTELVKTGQQAAKFNQKASKDFTGLSRVLQDLPFGFIAISNNLQQLVPAAGGVGLAFAAITSAITFAQIGLQNWTRKSKEAKEAQDEFSKSLNAAKAGAIETGVQLQAFVNIARDSSKSLKERNYALEQANKLMGDHGEKLTLVNINTKAVTEEVNKFTQALIAQAVAAKYSDKIADLIIKQKDASLAYGAALTTYNKVAKETADINKVTFSGGTGGTGGLGNVGAINKARGAFNDVSEAADTYKGITKELSQTTANFNENIQQSVSLFAELGLKQDETSKKAQKSAKDWYDAWKAQMTKLNTQGIVLGSFQEEVQKLVGPQGKLTITPSVTVAPALSPETQQKFDELKSLVNGLVDNFAIGIAESIGNALSGKGNFFGEFLKLIGESISAVGKYVIVSSKLLAKVKDALTAALFGSAGAGAGIAVGIGLVALGTILKNIPKFATGGLVTQPTLALVGEQGPERITPLGYEGSANNNWGGEVEFRIQGQALYGVLRRFEQNNRNIN